MKWVTHMVDEDRWVRVCAFVGVLDGGVGWSRWWCELAGDMWFYSCVEGGMEGRKRGKRVKQGITSKQDFEKNNCISL